MIYLEYLKASYTSSLRSHTLVALYIRPHTLVVKTERNQVLRAKARGLVTRAGTEVKTERHEVLT
jgi:hypothetical protein